MKTINKASNVKPMLESENIKEKLQEHSEDFQGRSNKLSWTG